MKMILFFNWQVAICFALPLEFIHPPTKQSPHPTNLNKISFVVFSNELRQSKGSLPVSVITPPFPCPQSNLSNFYSLANYKFSLLFCQRKLNLVQIASIESESEKK
jgi:hypothetical protein